MCIRDRLEGAFNNLVAYSALSFGDDGRSLTLDDAMIILKDVISPDGHYEITPNLILEIVADHYNVDAENILGSSRKKNIAWARHVCMYLCEKLTDIPLKEIGQTIGGRDHSTVINSRDRVAAEIARSKSFEGEIDTLVKKIKPM